MYIKEYLELLVSVELKSLSIREIQGEAEGANNPIENKKTLIR